MKICHLSTAHQYNDVRVFKKECMSLAQDGYSVSYIVPHENDELINGVSIIAIKRDMSKFKRVFVQPFRVLLKALKVKANVYHFHDFELWPIAIILRILGYQVIADIHEDVPGQLKQRKWVPERLKQPLSWLAAAIENNASRFVSGIVVADSELNKRFSQYNPCVSLVRNYPIFVELPEPEAKDDFTVFSLGGVFDERCANTLLTASNLVSDVSIEIAGGIALTYEDLSWQSDHCKYLGRLSFDDSQKLYANSDVLVVMFSDAPNHQDIKSNRLFESMYAGKPVIVSDLPKWIDFINQYQCGLTVSPNSAQDLSVAINWLKDNPKASKKMGENGRKAVYQHFSWDSEKNALLSLYKTIE